MTSETRHLKVVVFSDVVDSSETIFADELIGIQHIKADLALLQELLSSRGGSLVKKLGDGLLATFDAPSQALEFVQEASTHLSRRGGFSLQHRFGLHTGEIYEDGDDILGQGVHLASRLQTVSPVNGVAFVQSTHDIIDDRFRACAERVGDVNLHGFRRPMVCYTISAEAFQHLEERGRTQANDSSASDSSQGLLNRLLSGTPFRAERRLGRSGNTSSFLVRDGVRGRRAVLKLFPVNGKFLEAFLRGASDLERLRHPHIPRILDAYERDGWFCLLQEYIAGPSLRGSLDLVGHLDRWQALLRHGLDILSVAHGGGVLHGDINPDNLIVSVSDEQVYLVDFALMQARLATCGLRPLDPHLLEESLPLSLRQRERTGAEPSYFRAPELVRFARLDTGADLFGLGVSALVLATGRPASELYDLERGAWLLDDLPGEVRERLAPLLEESPARRPASAQEAKLLFSTPLAADPEASISAKDQPLGPSLGPKAVLLEALAVHYGPVVELLLEPWPDSIEAAEREGIRTRLVAAGLTAEDVDAAFAGLITREAVTLVPEPTPDGQDLAWLRQEIGPVAELIWTEELASLLVENPAAAAVRLRRAFVPEPVIARLLAKAHGDPPDPAPPAAPAPQGPPEGAIPVSEKALRSALLDVVGPMGERIFEMVQALPPTDQLGATLEALRSYGISDALLQEFALRVLRTS